MTKLAGDHVQILVDGYELTGDSNKLTIDDARDLLDATAFGDGVHKFIGGQRLAKLQHAGYLNADSARSHPVLNAVDVDGVISMLLGQNADPVVGDPVYSLLVQQGEYKTLTEFGKIIPFSGAFANRGDLGGWGVALAVPVEFTNTSNGSSVDNGAATSNGGTAFLHILTAAGSDTYTIVVEGSATGSFGGEESTLGTFTLDASQLGSERLALSGTIPQYVRWKATRTGSTGDTVKIAVAMTRF